jgi:hypothetical protein
VRRCGAEARSVAVTIASADHLHRRHSSAGSGTAIDDAGYRSQIGFRAGWDRDDDRLSVSGTRAGIEPGVLVELSWEPR